MVESDLTVEVALPVPFRRTFTYSVPESMREGMTTGARVVVPFRKRRMTGIVTAVGGSAAVSADYEIKPVAEILADGPLLSAELQALCHWVAEYYFAPMGEVLRVACPPAFTTSTRQAVQLTMKGKRRLEIDEAGAAPAHLFSGAPDLNVELQMLRFVAGEGVVEASAIRERFKGKVAAAAYLRLRAQGEIAVSGLTSPRGITSKTESVIRRSPQGEGGATMRRLSSAQRSILEYIERSATGIPLKALTTTLGVTVSTVRTLVKRGVVIEEQVAQPRIPIERAPSPRPIAEKSADLELTPDQKRALRTVEEALQQGRFAPILLLGVTASGKTEVYLRAIEKVLAEGGSALMLVPEIALTPATARAFAARFPNHVAILHSGLSEGERHDEWWRIRRGEARVVIGTRSAVFAPLENLRLIVVDEEHDGSYKQQESPRYQGRDVAVMRAKRTDAVILLGSATPSMESFYNVERGKYRLVTLKTRIESRPLARVSVVDMRSEFREAKKNEMLSRDLVQAIKSRLDAEEQVLVLLNRRGFSSFVLCRACGATRQCPNCSITMTYHKRRHFLLCHYCSATAEVPKVCWQCGSEHLYFVGAGTEQIEEKVKALFPMARLARLDRDTAQGRGAYRRILGEFSEGVTDILVGTQMIAKGHDFPNVTLVGVLNADGALGFPDFRSAERTFQLLAQVAGRSGRGAVPGEVVLQAYYPDHYAIRFAAKQDFMEFYHKEIHYRRMMHYPPFAQLALVGIRHSDFDEAMKLAKALGQHLRENPAPEVRVLGPAISPLARLKREFRWQLLLKSSRRPPLKQMIERCLRFCDAKKITEPNVLIDLDPTNMM